MHEIHLPVHLKFRVIIIITQVGGGSIFFLFVHLAEGERDYLRHSTGKPMKKTLCVYAYFPGVSKPCPSFSSRHLCTLQSSSLQPDFSRVISCFKACHCGVWKVVLSASKQCSWTINPSMLFVRSWPSPLSCSEAELSTTCLLELLVKHCIRGVFRGTYHSSYHIQEAGA